MEVSEAKGGRHPKGEQTMPPIPTKVLAAAEESMFGMTDMGFCLACGADDPYVSSVEVL